MSGPLTKRDLVARALHHSGCGRLIQRAGTWRGLLILNYHRVGAGAKTSDFDRNLWSATAEDFDAQIRTVCRDYDVIGLKDLEEIQRQRRGRFILITFDDGYRDNYEEAFPILKQHGASAIFFLATGYLDEPRLPWWDEIAWMVRRSPLPQLPASVWLPDAISFENPDRERAIVKLLKIYKRLDGDLTTAFINHLAEATQSGRCPEGIARQLWMTWPMVREMQAAGMDFGGHTVNHPILANLSPEEQDAEVGGCQQRLIQELGQPATAFSYPVGGAHSYNEHTMAALQRHGFQWGFTYIGGHVPLPVPQRYAIPRAAIETEVDTPIFQAILAIPQWFSIP